MKVYLDMVGCRLNQAELESIAMQFRQAGHTLTSELSQADLVVVNSCLVTASAASDSRQKVRQAHRASSAQIILTGCWATLNPAEAASLYGVSRVISNQDKDALVPLVLGLPGEELTHHKASRAPIPGSRTRTRAFIKVQDGCDNRCTYCITTLARGPSRSRKIEQVMEDVNASLDGGAQEIVFTGVHLGSWGYDLQPRSQLPTLIRTVLQSSPIPRLRLSSLEPWDIHEDFFTLWQDPRLCRHLHLPLQSGSSSTLKRMGRRITPAAYARLVQQARLAIPDLAVSTDIITGFPGETEQEFQESLEFMRGINFSGGHVFTYSPRPGTAAAGFPNQVSHATARERSVLLQEIFHQGKRQFQQNHIGKEVQVLFEKATPVGGNLWELSGLTGNYLRVNAISAAPYHNQLVPVHLTKLDGEDLVGDLLPAAP